MFTKYLKALAYSDKLFLNSSGVLLLYQDDIISTVELVLTLKNTRKFQVRKRKSQTSDFIKLTDYYLVLDELHSEMYLIKSEDIPLNQKTVSLTHFPVWTDIKLVQQKELSYDVIHEAIGKDTIEEESLSEDEENAIDDDLRDIF